MTLELKDVCLSNVGSQSADSLSFIVRAGEVKQLLANMSWVEEKRNEPEPVFSAIMGLQPVCQGYITIDGELVNERSAETLRKFMSYVPRQIRWPDEEKNQLPTDEMHRLLLERATTDQKPIVLVECITLEDDLPLCERMAAAGAAVVMTIPNQNNDISLSVE